MPKLIWSHASIRDLREIDTYISQHNETAAARILRAIRASAALLERHPQAGPNHKDQSFRYLPVTGTSYILIYHIGPKRVEVLRVHHTAQNWRDTPQ